MMQPKDLLVFLEKGDRTMEHLKEGTISSREATSTTIDLEYYRRLLNMSRDALYFNQYNAQASQANQAAQSRNVSRLTGF